MSIAPHVETQMAARPAKDGQQHGGQASDFKMGQGQLQAITVSSVFIRALRLRDLLKSSGSIMTPGDSHQAATPATAEEKDPWKDKTVLSLGL
jgi:hypothetical protein